MSRRPLPAPSPRTPLAILFLLALVAGGGCTTDLPERAASPEEVERWEARAAQVTITRDEWGIPHIHAPTDADAVFGLMYSQAEDDFPRIEENFLTSQGRMAEARGEGEIWRDLRMQMFIDPAEMQRLYGESPPWLQALMDAWADGLNYFLHVHPEVRPQVLDRFEPWMALTFSEGSIGGDIERVNLRELEALYGETGEPTRREGGEVANVGTGGTAWPGGIRVASSLAPVESDPVPGWGAPEPRGSNGIAIAPRLTREGNALLLINPHTSFYFRHEAHIRSDEGLNVYGALTWGQFFVYQGFNEHAGWMHTSSRADNIDEFLEEVVERDGALYYRYGEEERPFTSREVTIRYREDGGSLGERRFTVYRTHRGPVVRAVDGRWVSVALMEEPMNALIQSYSRTRAHNLEEYLEIMGAHTNSSNNTLFADSEGNVAYLHSNFVPVRDPRFDYDHPVEGWDPATDWQGVHALDESPNAINPATGWAMCTNNWPWSAAGAASPRQADFPAYMDRGTENPRGEHALLLLEGSGEWTLEGLRDAAYSPHLPAFARMVPPLVAGWDALPEGDALKERTAEAVAVLRDWDFGWDVASVPTTVAVFWGTEFLSRVQARASEAGMDVTHYAAERTTAEERLEALVPALERLEEEFGDWETPWGEVNRFQRLSGEIRLEFDDDAPSLPVGFTSARWGSLASYGAAPRGGTHRWYGTSGNSFVAVVEFGERVRAVAITAGGLSNDPDSPHFDDQARRYAEGDLRPVHFHPDEIEAAGVRTYRPGER